MPQQFPFGNQANMTTFMAYGERGIVMPTSLLPINISCLIFFPSTSTQEKFSETLCSIREKLNDLAGSELACHSHSYS